jgi:hypothetical protein
MKAEGARDGDYRKVLMYPVPVHQINISLMRGGHFLWSGLWWGGVDERVDPGVFIHGRPRNRIFRTDASSISDNAVGGFRQISHNVSLVGTIAGIAT